MENFSTPNFLIPKNYYPKNWNRSSLKGIIKTGKLKNDSILIYGNEGIFIKAKQSREIKTYVDGYFPKAPRLKRTNHVIIDTLHSRFLAATNGGLFSCLDYGSKWEKIELPDNTDAVIKILTTNDSIIVVTSSGFYVSKNIEQLIFNNISPKKNETNEQISWFKVFLELHDGSIWGLPGRLLWDVSGLVLFFLCLSAFYIWFYPKKWKKIINVREKDRQNRKKIYKKYS